MKVKVIKKSFYANKVNKIGDIIEIKEEKCPGWAEIVESDNAKNNKQTKAPEPQTDTKIEELSKLKDDEIKEILDNLLNDAVDKGIEIEFENKTDIALILELEEALKGKE